MKEKICKIVILCLSTLLLLNGCEILDDSATGSTQIAETTSGADSVNETIMEGATTETFAETVPVNPNADFYARYQKSQNLYNLAKQTGKEYYWDSVYYVYEPDCRYYGKTSGRMVEVAPNVYMGIYDWEFLQEVQSFYADENLSFIFSMYPGDIVDSYFLDENTAETVAKKIWDSEEEQEKVRRTPQITEEEYVSILKDFQYILDENEICYYREGEIPYVYYRDRAYQKYTVTCCMTVEEILSLNIPEGEYITIGFYAKCK